MAVFLILIQFSIIISKLSDRSKNLAQELSLLKFEIEKYQKQNIKDKTEKTKTKAKTDKSEEWRAESEE